MLALTNLILRGKIRKALDIACGDCFVIDRTSVVPALLTFPITKWAGIFIPNK